MSSQSLKSSSLAAPAALLLCILNAQQLTLRFALWLTPRLTAIGEDLRSRCAFRQLTPGAPLGETPRPHW
ncbi:MAG: hypothetical protein ACREPR_19025, partial [Brasilonema sp.]